MSQLNIVEFRKTICCMGTLAGVNSFVSNVSLQFQPETAIVQQISMLETAADYVTLVTCDAFDDPIATVSLTGTVVHNAAVFSPRTELTVSRPIHGTIKFSFNDVAGAPTVVTSVVMILVEFRKYKQVPKQAVL
jgi:hypothetical protein